MSSSGEGPRWIAEKVSWQALLEEGLGRPVVLSWGKSRTSPVVFKDQGHQISLRLNRFFMDAPEEVARDLLAWARNGRRAKKACKRLDAWIAAAIQRLPPKPARALRLRTRGAVHDLEALTAPLIDGVFQSIYGKQFPPPALTWGRRMPRRARHTLRLGSFDRERRLIRIHPVLDQKNVPSWFVAFVLYHEILHDLVPDEEGGSRHHSRRFRELEAAHPDYERALRWEKRNVARLIRDARRLSRHEPDPLGRPYHPSAPMDRRTTAAIVIPRQHELF